MLCLQNKTNVDRQVTFTKQKKLTDKLHLQIKTKQKVYKHVMFTKHNNTKQKVYKHVMFIKQKVDVKGVFTK